MKFVYLSQQKVHMNLSYQSCTLKRWGLRIVENVVAMAVAA
jgi:hypothetical protein